MENEVNPFVFQADAEIVLNHYKTNKNYKIEFDESNPKEFCAIYFSSNDLYYPNSEVAFKESVIDKDRYEWYKNRINYAHKHIFVRDIKKQWYLTGINDSINSAESLIEFLRSETKDYKPILVGSSAGGFMSVIVGQTIGAFRIFSFNGQFEIFSLLKKTNVKITDPILYRYKETAFRKYYDATTFIHEPKSIFYFYSNRSGWDLEQNEHSSRYSINRIGFSTSNHGIPFLKSNLPVVLNMKEDNLMQLSGQSHHPLVFSLKVVGLASTIKGLQSIIMFALNKLYIKTFQRWKSKML